MNDFFETQDHTAEFDIDDIQNTNPVIMALTYIFPFLPFIVSPNSRYAKFHANQGILCWIVGIVLALASSIVCKVFSIIPLINLFLPWVINKLVGVVILAFFVLGIFNAFNGKAKELPLIGHFTIFK